MKRQDKIDTIIIFKKVIKELESGVHSFICNILDNMGKGDDIKKAKEYLYSEVPRENYNKTFYDHRLYNKWNPFLYNQVDQSHRLHPWWFINNSNSWESDIKEGRRQRILFLRILIDKLNK